MGSSIAALHQIAAVQCKQLANSGTTHAAQAMSHFPGGQRLLSIGAEEAILTKSCAEPRIEVANDAVPRAPARAAPCLRTG
jgi:hypothetical protein